MADIKDVLKGLECIETNGVDCRGCHYRDAGDCCAIHIAKDASELLKENRKWIPVKERMPDDEGFYLVSADYGNFIPWIAEMVDFRGVKGFSNSVVSPTIGAWMPLPEPWKKE